MKLDIFFSCGSLGECAAKAGEYFGGKAVRLEREEMSIYETYRVYSVGRVYIPGLWRHRVVCRGGVYYFGTIDGGFEI